MQALSPFLASLVIPTVRDDTLHIFHVALLSGARVFEVAQKRLLFPELLRTPSLPPHPAVAQCPFARAHFFICVQLLGNSMSLSSNNRYWVR